MLSVFPMTLKAANELVRTIHRHHQPVVGYKFAIGAFDRRTGNTVGAAIVGRPVARMTDAEIVAEVTRLVTDGHKNACSLLYSACARVAKEMGYLHIQTFLLEDEPATSVKAAGWKFEGMTNGGTWNRLSRGNRREDQPMGRKQRWGKSLVRVSITEQPRRKK